MSTKLLPCPFCGSAKIDTIFIRDGRACCCRCGASTRAFQPNAEKACIAAWNKRAAEHGCCIVTRGILEELRHEAFEHSHPLTIRLVDAILAGSKPLSDEEIAGSGMGLR